MKRTGKYDVYAAIMSKVRHTKHCLVHYVNVFVYKYAIDLKNFMINYFIKNFRENVPIIVCIHFRNIILSTAKLQIYSILSLSDVTFEICPS